MPRKRKDIENSLKDKGFRCEKTHHRLYKYYDGDQFTGVKTFISKGSGYKDYDDALLGKMAKQLKLDKRGVLDLIDCPMTEDDYRKILRGKGYL